MDTKRFTIKGTTLAEVWTELNAIPETRLIGKDAKAGDELSPGTFYLGWNVIKDGVKCLSCGGYAKSVESTVRESVSGCAAFLCGLCGKRWIGVLPTPDYNDC